MSEKETEDSVPPVDKRLSRASKRNSLETVVDPAAGVTRRSPRSSPPSLMSDGNILNVSHHSSDGEDESSVDTDEDDRQEESDVQNNPSRGPRRNFQLLPKSQLVDENAYCGLVTNKALRRYNLSDLLSIEEILAVKVDIRKVNTVVDRKGIRAIVAATALRKVVIKLESALIAMSPEHQGVVVQENLESDNKLNDIRRDVEKRLQKFKKDKQSSKNRGTTEAALNRTLNFDVEDVHTIERFLIELNRTTIDHSNTTEIPSLIAACKELVHLCDEFNVPDSDIQVIFRLYSRFHDVEKSMKEIQTLLSQNRNGPPADRDDGVLEMANRTLAYSRTWKISVRDLYASSGLDTPKLDVKHDIKILTIDDGNYLFMFLELMALSMSTRGTDHDRGLYCYSKLGAVLRNKVHKWRTSFEQIKYQLVSKIFDMDRIIKMEMANYYRMPNSDNKSNTAIVIDKLFCLDLALTRLMEIRSNNILESDIMNVTFHSHMFIQAVIAHLPCSTRRKLITKLKVKFVDFNDLSGSARISDILSVVSAHIHELQDFEKISKLVSGPSEERGGTPDLISMTRNPRKSKQTGNTNFALSVVSEFSGQTYPGVLFGGGSDDKEGPGIFGNCKSSGHEHKVIECEEFYKSTVNRRMEMCFERRSCFLCGHTHRRFMYGKKCPNIARAMKCKILCQQCCNEVSGGQRNYPYMSVLCNKHIQISTSDQIVQHLRNYHSWLEMTEVKFNRDLGEDWSIPSPTIVRK